MNADSLKMESWIKEAWRDVWSKVEQSSQRIGACFPHASVAGQYKLEPASWWTAGFWPGLLWLLYESDREAGEAFKQLAIACEDQLDEVLLQFDKLDHDIGFMWSLTSVAQYRIEGTAASRQRALLAASALAGRFNIKGNYIRAWNPWREGERNEGWAIIDCMMNLPLLYWASEATQDPRFKHIAMAHADTVLKYFIRKDGSVYHIAIFDADSGEHIGYNGGQGYANESGWSRGTSWALYGMTLSYQYTGEQRYLDAAKQVAHYFIANLPDDAVPVWDFRIPQEVKPYRDSSAGACAACGLLALAELLPAEQAELYRKQGERILQSLYENYGSFADQQQEGLILHGTSHYPEQKNLDVPLIYGDYFFVEGLARLHGSATIAW